MGRIVHIPGSSAFALPVDQPFSMTDTAAYRNWRDRKLRGYPLSTEELAVQIADPRNLSRDELERLHRTLGRANFALYDSGRPLDKPGVKLLGRQLGLSRLDQHLCADDDGISSIQADPGGTGSAYIPYSNRELNWHTDGYYNPPAAPIRTFILHCVRPSASGGENKLLDPELVYILLRDDNPDHIRALMHPEAMTIPANRKTGAAIRGDSTGPVFSISNSGALHMRYTARTRSIVWRDDPLLTEARHALSNILNTSEFVLTHRLRAGQGLICRNVLHARTAFQDSRANGRLLYRARYYDAAAVVAFGVG